MRIERIQKEVYDGDSEGFYKKGISFNAGCKYYNVRYSELNLFKDLKSNFSEQEFNEILSGISGKKKHPFESYVSQEGSTLSYFHDKTDLVLVSYREHQPGRYKVYLEGRIEKVLV